MAENNQIINDLLDTEQEDTMEGKFLIFRIAGEEYGIPIRNVTEIIGVQSVTDLPGTPPYVKGVINLRGKVIPVIDVRIRFSMEERDYDDRTCIIVVNIKEIKVGLIVDSVSEVLDIPANDIEPPPKVSQGAGTFYIQGLGKVDNAVKILLDTQKLLFEDELAQLEEVIG
ncbi:MAG: purine-binding chemotaxis protein CheW [FCB group bacterium]|nr:purine-binding chemotaxis protein CheW [FCB group bacterium]